ncbi:N-acetylmuramoyl-L-alanine amidase [Candidatus Dependentiae bacterium]|nr:N-acetylmuramoyl-L-alanine amidase [Candidatus Dependentiae bacterium]
MKQILLSILFFKIALSFNPAHGSQFSGDQIIIVLDPTGDAQHTGRIIEDSFERSITLKLAELIKKDLENENIKVRLTRFAGETLEPYQNISFANRLNADLFINLNLFQDSKQINEIYIYNLMYNKVSDLWPKKFDDLFICPLEDAYLTSINKSIQYSTLFAQYLSSFPTKSFTIFGPYAIPFKPLVGLKQPGFAIEIGINEKDNITNLVQPISNAIKHLIQKLS